MERGTNKEGPDEEKTDEKRPNEKELDECIMHQVHTSHLNINKVP
jgi:hypothetical protein